MNFVYEYIHILSNYKKLHGMIHMEFMVLVPPRKENGEGVGRDGIRAFTYV